MVGADPVSGPGDAGRTVSVPVNNLVLRVISAVVLAPVAIYAAYLGGWPFAVFWVAAALAVLWEWISLVTGLGWIIAGIGYAGIMLLAPLLLRVDNAYGFLALVLLFAIVWTTDVLGYFAGRAFGGPKLLPAVSPKKTWSGAIAGTLGAIMAQLGDLFESWVKRQFGAKDASHLIPGHGGVMDRLDGFWAAALLGCLIGLARGGFDGAARGLLVW